MHNFQQSVHAVVIKAVMCYHHKSIRTRNECAIMTRRAEFKDSIADREFRGLTLGIKDMSVFDVPKACQNGTSTSPISYTSMSTLLLPIP
jgi:hypothetical protein